MKNTIKLCTLFSLAFIIIAGIAAAMPFSNQEVQAATQTHTVIDDSFNSLADAGYWDTNDFGISRENYSLAISGPTHKFERTTLYKDYKVDGDCEIRFKLTAKNVPSAGNVDNWFGIQFGQNSPSNETSFAGGMLVSQDNSIMLMDNSDGATAMLNDASLGENPSTSSSYIGIGKSGVANVRFVLSKTNKTLKYDSSRVVYNVAYYVWKEGTAQPASPVITWEIAAEGYFGFTAYNNMLVRIYDFKILENNAVVSAHDFEKDLSAQIGYSNDNGSWRANGLSEKNVFIATDAIIDTKDKVSGVLLSKAELSIDPYCNKQFEISFDAQASALTNGATFGIGFGLSSSSQAADERNFVGIQGAADGKWKFVMMRDGRVRLSSSSFESFPVGFSRVKITGYYDGHAEISFAGRTETFNNLKLDGNFAVGVAGTAASGVKFDNVIVTQNSRLEPKAPASDVLINFSGTKTTEEAGETFVSKYIDDSKWYRGPRVTIPRYSMSENRDYVQFVNANEGSIFGSRTRFEEFICRFSITVSENKSIASSTSAIGLSFAKKALFSSNNASPGIFFVKTTTGMQMQVYGADCAQASAGVINITGMDLWSSTNVASSPVTYRVMVVVRGGTANVYFAPDSADDWEMTVLRASLTGFDSYGFVGVAGYGGASFHLNDFSVINTAIRR